MEAEKKTYFIIDFDSTFVKIETLDELASIALLNDPDKDRIIADLKEITRRGMEGKISFNTSLKLRLKLFKANRIHLEKLVKTIKKKISASVLRNKTFFKLYKDNIYIVSGGFKDYIIPVFKPFGIPENHILANTFIYNRRGEIVGFDEKNPLSTNGGKIKVLKKLNLKGKKYVIGDGATDYEIKKAGLADKFFYFSENVFRDSVSKNADVILPNLDEFLYRFKLPRALSYPKSRMKILLLENVHAAAIDIFKKEGYNIEVIAEALGEEELLEKISEASVIAIRSKVILTDKLLKRAKRLLAIGRFGIRVNNIDLKTATKMGITVFNTSFTSLPKAAQYVSEKIITFINTGGTVMSVNFPNVFLPELKTSHRLIHIHKNVPGVLANLNKVISSFNVNIEGQYLKTNQDIGYVITDVSKTYDKNIVKKLKEIPNTIRVRVLY